MFPDCDPSLFDDMEFKEDSVREVIIAPILARLGYSLGSNIKYDIAPLLIDRAQVFFVCQFEAAQASPDRGTMRRDALLTAQLDHQFIQRQVALRRDPTQGPISHARALAMPAAIALRLWFQRPARPLQKHRVVHEFDRNPELRRRRTVRVAFRDKINDPLKKLHRKWVVHHRPPSSAINRGNHKSVIKGILNRKGRNTL